jgi:hypothetical protein
MKKILLIILVIFSSKIFAQDIPVEPMQSSYDNKDLIMLALAALGVLMAIYFLWRRAKKRRRGY